MSSWPDMKTHSSDPAIRLRCSGFAHSWAPAEIFSHRRLIRSIKVATSGSSKSTPFPKVTSKAIQSRLLIQYLPRLFEEFIHRRQPSFRGRIPPVPEHASFIDDKRGPSSSVLEIGGAGRKGIILRQNISIEIADHRESNPELSGPGKVTIGAVDAHGHDLDVETAKLAVGVPKLGHLVRSAATEIERVSGQDQGRALVKKRPKRNL